MTAVLCVRNAAETLQSCLDSLEREGIKGSKVVIVDGLSSDGTLEIAKESGCRIFSDEGNGFAFARKLGIEKSDTDFTLVLGPDDAMGPGSTGVLLSELQSSKDIAAVATRKHVRDAKNFWERGMNSYYDSLPSGEVATVGNPTLYRSSVLRDHVLDDKFSANEDTDWCLRIREAGLKVIRSSSASAIEIETFRFNAVARRWLWYGAGDLAFIQKWISESPRKALRHLVHPSLEYLIRVPLNRVTRGDLSGALFSFVCWSLRTSGLISALARGKRYGRNSSLVGR